MSYVVRHAKSQPRRGAAALELAILLSVFLLMVLSMIELGRAIMVQQVLVNSAREAARRGVVPGATDDQLSKIANRYLKSAGVWDSGSQTAIHTLQVTPRLSEAPSKSPIAVSVSVPYSEVSWGLMRMFDNITLRANVVMRKEQ